MPGGGVVFGQRGHAGGLSDPVHGQAAMLQRQAGRAQLGGARQHRMHHAFGRGAAQLHARGADAVFDAFERVRHQASSQRRGGGHQQRLGLAARDLVGAAADLLQAGQRAFDIVIQQKALLGGRHAGAAAREQGIADLGLQFLQQPADRGLRASQQPSGSGDAARGHDGREGLELTKFHGS
ncbi:hypothetical protein D3C72_1592140 [compost metagenome]